MLGGKTLVFGPSRSGKTYFSEAFKALGLHAIDAEKDTNLIKWRNDRTSEVVVKPDEMDEAWLARNHFTINPEELQKFLAEQDDIIVFAHAWNILDAAIINQFDRVAYMSLPESELERRLKINRPDHRSDGNTVVHEFFRRRHRERTGQAKQRGIALIDATLEPNEFYRMLCGVTMVDRSKEK